MDIFDFGYVTVDEFLRLIDPNPWFIVKLRSQLSTNGIEFDEMTRQQLMSSTLTDYEKNDILLHWLQNASNSTWQVFVATLKDSGQGHGATVLEQIPKDGSLHVTLLSIC